MLIGVTGATGKIGRWIVKVLLERRHAVRAMIRPTRQGFWGNTESAVEELRAWGAQLFPADFADDASLHRFADGIDVLVHNGYHHVNEELHPVEWTNLNILATIKLYDAMWRLGRAKQILFISSGAVYGTGPDMEDERFPNHGKPIDECTPRAARGLYAAYKSCIEDATVVFKNVHGLAASSTLRPGGEGTGELLGFRHYDAKGFLSDEIKRMLAGEKVTLELPPQIVCVDGRDLGLACDLLIRKGRENPAAIDDWYLSGNTPISIDDFRRIFREIFPMLPLDIEQVPQPRRLSYERIGQVGYQPRGSEATLRDHLLELSQKLRAPAHG